MSRNVVYNEDGLMVNGTIISNSNILSINVGGPIHSLRKHEFVMSAVSNINANYSDNFLTRLGVTNTNAITEEDLGDIFDYVDIVLSLENMSLGGKKSRKRKSKKRKSKKRKSRKRKSNRRRAN